MDQQDRLSFTTKETKVSHQGERITLNKSSLLQKHGLRQFDGEHISSAASVGAFDETALGKQCAENAILGIPSKQLFADDDQSASFTLQSECQIDEKEFQLAAEDYIQSICKRFPKFHFAGSFSRNEVTVFYSNSNGKKLEKSYVSFDYFMDLRRQGSPNISDDYFMDSSLHKMDWDALVNWKSELLESFDQKIELKTGKQKILIHADRTFLRKLSESLRADKYYQGSALFSDKMGEQIFNPAMNLSELYLAPQFGIIKPFDYEGTLAKSNKLNLIEQGKITNVICDLKEAQRWNLQSTGNGFRSFDSSTSLSFSGLQLEPGHRSYKEILKDLDECIIVEMAYGGDYTALGDLSTPVQLAYVWKDGKVVGKAPQFSLSSSLQKAFGPDLLEIASNGASPNSQHPYILCEMEVLL